jgi:mono/diheme cytochrome c family protein
MAGLLRTWAGLLGLVLLSGCESEYPPDYRYPVRTDPLVIDRPAEPPVRLDRPGEFPDQILVHVTSEKDKQKILNPENLKSKYRQQLEAALEKLFGTPRHPKVGGLDAQDQDTLKLDDGTLAEGSASYRANCLHCHGLTGNGRGPTAPWVNPHPRDYRLGVFKFTSTVGDVMDPATNKVDNDLGGNVRKPRREDLLRTVREGIEGTTMPSFGLLAEHELQALVSYVIHLSIRGDVEFNVMRTYLQEVGEEDFQGQVQGIRDLIVRRWTAAASERNVIRPDDAYPLATTGDPRQESAVRGWQKFRASGGAGCIGCHQDYGRQSAYFYDSWGTIGRATDLTQGVYRGGRRPIDLYWRIHSGINGSNMTAFSNALKTEDIWDMVNFLQVLPYKQMREEYGITID